MWPGWYWVSRSYILTGRDLRGALDLESAILADSAGDLGSLGGYDWHHHGIFFSITTGIHPTAGCSSIASISIAEADSAEQTDFTVENRAGFGEGQRGGSARRHGQMGTHSGAFSGFNHGGMARGFSRTRTVELWRLPQRRRLPRRRRFPRWRWAPVIPVYFQKGNLRRRTNMRTTNFKLMTFPKPGLSWMAAMALTNCWQSGNLH